MLVSTDDLSRRRRMAKMPALRRYEVKIQSSRQSRVDLSTDHGDLDELRFEVE